MTLKRAKSLANHSCLTYHGLGIRRTGSVHQRYSFRLRIQYEMPKISQDAAMGIAIVLACLMILVREKWFLAETTKGQRLVRWFGAVRALWILRAVLLTISAVGGLLAGGVIQPIRW